MELRAFSIVFGTIFFAELGDKTQLATLLYAAEFQHSKLTVFLAASCALVVTSALGVLGGALVGRYVDERMLAWIAGRGWCRAKRFTGRFRAVVARLALPIRRGPACISGT